ncbi:hypothetical protein CONPUDRAFT_103096 [Coniophora puteana RWD-64-598 SS2]|uniref:C2 domain-containing protein n=1 Tax=Coniophora puteana (strain RWD-64-598) TaxID=741705 RepID=A0A5M3MSZ2_CONPW|nr:uncharacterized protein CONPUDRAFT_103096 [Coniophora puteana RWD-64-598 SS2]EIW82210.1 hypothetical protein CONPUDRAFT_103096 [Coniophora puteana RWD-64-598 SS2]
MSSTPREIGTLIVVILKARNLVNKRHFGKQDPYCAATLNGDTRRTKAVKRGGQHPEWDEEFRFTIFEDVEDELARTAHGSDTPPPPPPKKASKKKIKGGKTMRLSCYSDEPRDPELIGEALVNLTEVLTRGETDEWFPLLNKDKYSGEVYLELTFWSNEPPPQKKPATKTSVANKQYGGPGSFVPAGESNSSLNGSGGNSRVSLVNGNEGNPLNSLPSAMRSSSQLQLYAPAYEQKRRVSPGPVDRLTNDFGELGVADHHRRDSFPPMQTLKPSASSGFQSLQSHPHHYDPHQSIDGSAFHEGTGSLAGPPSQYRVPPDSYYPTYDAGGSSGIGYRAPTRQGPRYSMPTSSSGFAPIPTPAPPMPTSSFGSTPQYVPESSGFAPAHPSHSIHPTTVAPAPYSQNPPPSTRSRPPSHSFSTPASSFVQNPPQPEQQYPSQHEGMYPFPTESQHPYSPRSAPPPPSHHLNALLPAASAPPVAHSASQPPLHSFAGLTHATPSPSHDYGASAPTPGPPSMLTGTPIPPPLQTVPGSRPLPQPQTAPRQASLTLPPTSSYPQHPPRSPTRASSVNGSGFNGPVSYSNIPPPPAPPARPPSQYGGSTQAYGTPPNEMQSMPDAATLQQSYGRPSANPSPIRPALPQPPMQHHQSAQSALFQPIPPPPPPPELPSHMQQHPPPSRQAVPTSSFSLGPLPRPPQYIDHYHGYAPPAPAM